MVSILSFLLEYVLRKVKLFPSSVPGKSNNCNGAIQGTPASSQKWHGTLGLEAFWTFCMPMCFSVLHWFKGSKPIPSSVTVTITGLAGPGSGDGPVSAFLALSRRRRRGGHVFHNGLRVKWRED